MVKDGLHIKCLERSGRGGWGGPNNDDFACRLCLLEAAKGGEMRLPSGRWS